MASRVKGNAPTRTQNAITIIPSNQSGKATATVRNKKRDDICFNFGRVTPSCAHIPIIIPVIYLSRNVIHPVIKYNKLSPMEAYYWVYDFALDVK